MKKPLRWYHYAAKAILIAITIPVSPIIILIALASGDHPLGLYEIMWKDD